MNASKLLLRGALGTVMLWGMASLALAQGYSVPADGSVINLSPTISREAKQYWPGGYKHHMPVVSHYIEHGDSPYSADLIILDNDTATQLDCPPHMMPPVNSGLPNAGIHGDLTCDKLPAWQLAGEVVKVDGRNVLDSTSNGVSPIYTVDMVKAAEQRIGRSLERGDAVLYWSGYNDKYGAMDPDALVFDAMRAKHPAWPDPNWDTSDYVGSQGVVTVGVDSPSIGAFGATEYSWKATQSYRSQVPLALESHLGVFKHGGIDMEGLINLDQVPDGSLYVGLPVKIENNPTNQSRAAAITDKALAARLVRAVKAKKVVDLSVLNAEDAPVYWPGRGVGGYSFPFYRIKKISYYDESAPYWVNSQIMDSRVGTHISPPAHYGLPSGFSASDYRGDARQWAQAYESQYGKIQNTEMTSDKVPVGQLMGPARVIDVQHRVGTTDRSDWPASPAITVDDVKAHESMYGALKAGQVVIFKTGHTTTHFAMPRRGRANRVYKAPLDGAAEGWPAPTPETIQYLADKGIMHAAIDAPIMGSVNGREAAFTYWTAANEGMVFTEYLMNVGDLPPTGAFYIFLNPKIKDNHGGPGRAIAILPHG